MTAFRGDPELAGLVADRGVDCCLMHMLGNPRTMQDDPRYDDVVSEVKAFLEQRLAFAVAEGIAEERVMLDPGHRLRQDARAQPRAAPARLDEIVALGRPVVFGVSRKSFLGKITGREPGDRGVATAAANVLALERGASVFRVHDVPETLDALAVAAATLAGGWPLTTEDYDDDDLTEDDDDEREGPEVGVTIEIVGLSLFTHHGVTPAEREVGQRLVLDVRFDVGEPDALVTDRVEDTVDYGEVCQVIALMAQQRSYKTLERLCAVIAERLASQFGAESVTVKASKPEPPIPLPLEEVSVEVWREEHN